MNTQLHIEERLWNYIDENVTAEEKSSIEKLLVNNIEWRIKYHELLEVHTLLQSSELEEPSLRFTKNVMEEIARFQIAPATKNYINKKIIWGIAGFLITMIVGFLIYGFAQIDWSVPSDSNMPIDFNKVDFSKFFNNTYINIFMMINVVLALFLLDRWLANKKKSSHKEA